MSIDLVIFDCDGVLVDSEPVVSAVESAYFATLGYTIDPHEARLRFQGRTVSDVARAVEDGIGRNLSSEELYTWGMTTALALVERLEPVPGVADAVAAVRSRGIPICVASQSPPPRVRLSLSIAGFSETFGEHVYTASMVALPKPAPDLFLYAAEHMRAAPERTVVIEDSPTGILAAQAAGMTVFGYADPQALGAAALRDAGARVFDSMRELPALIASLL